MTATPRRRFGRGLAVALIALIFGLGVVVGIFATHLFYAHRLRHPGSFGDAIVNSAAARVTGRLDLTPTQRQELDVILESTRHEVQVLRRDLLDRIRALRTSALQDLFTILDDEQREQLRRFHESEGKILDDYLPEDGELDFSSSLEEEAPTGESQAGGPPEPAVGDGDAAQTPP